MDISVLSISFLVVFLLTLAFLSILNSVRVEKGIDLANKAGIPVVSAICLGWLLLQVMFPQDLIVGTSFILNFYPFILAAFTLSLSVIQKSKGRRFWDVLFVTTLSVVFLPENLLVFQGFLPLVLDRLITAILWAFFVSGYSTMDKIMGLTFIQTNALCLCFSLVPLISVSQGLFSFASDFSFYPLMISLSLLAFMSFKRKTPDLLLGRCGAVPLGYLMGLFLIILTAKGWIWAAFVMPMYYYFEIIYSRINILIHHANPQPKIFTFFISKVIRDNLGSKKILSSLFLFMLGFGLCGILLEVPLYDSVPSYVSLYLGGLLLLCVIYKLLHWGSKSVTYRSMFKDTKDMGAQILLNLKESVETMKKKK